MRPIFALCLIALPLSASPVGAQAPSTQALSDQANITLVPATELNWAQTPEGVKFAPLHGDRSIEPYFAMVHLPAGLQSPPHTKSATMIGLMVSGEMTHVRADANPATAPRIGPGGYYEIPANLAHVSSCVSADPCVTLLYQNGAFDFVPVSR